MECSELPDGLSYLAKLVHLGSCRSAFPFRHDWCHIGWPFQCPSFAHHICCCPDCLNRHPRNPSPSYDRRRLPSPSRTLLVGLGFKSQQPVAADRRRRSYGSRHHAHTCQWLKLHCRCLQEKCQQCNCSQHIREGYVWRRFPAIRREHVQTTRSPMGYQLARLLHSVDVTRSGSLLQIRAPDQSPQQVRPRVEACCRAKGETDAKLTICQSGDEWGL